MTTPAYTWPRISGLENGDFETGVGPNYTSWTESVDVTNVTGNGGVGQAPSINQGGAIRSSKNFWEPSVGRWFDPRDRLMLTFYAKAIASGGDLLRVQAFLSNGTSLNYSYDWEKGTWEEFDGTADQDTGNSYMLHPSTAWAQYTMPMIESPVESDDALDHQTWGVRLRFWNDSSSAVDIAVDDVVVSPWAASPTITRLGPWMIASNGHNYPVKFDARTGSVTELSLVPPYWTPNASLPADTVNSTGGLLTDSFYGFMFTFFNEETQEESVSSRGIATSSAGFTVDATGGSSAANSIDLEFSGVELPNSEIAKAIDDPSITHIFIYRTEGRADVEAAAGDVKAGLVYYDGAIKLSSTTLWVSVLGDDEIKEQRALNDIFPDPTAVSAPGFTVSQGHRSRLFAAGGREFRRGMVDLTNNSNVVDGRNAGATGSDAPTDWNRSVEGMVLRIDGDSRDYDIERFIYEDDDGTGTSNEALYLSESYVGSTATEVGYTIRSRNVVRYSEEGRPYHFSGGNFFVLDGDEGGDVTMLISAGDTLLAATKEATFAFNYSQTPQEFQLARPIMRDIGCIAKNSVAEIRGVAYWLSDEGVVRSDGGSVEVFSNALQDIFTDPRDPDYVLRSRTDQLATEAHAIHYPRREQYLLAVRTKSAETIGCNLILAYNYFYDSWDLFRLRTGLVAWHWGVDSAGNPLLMFTDSYGQVYAWDYGTVDGVGEVNNEGKVTGKIAAAGTNYADLSISSTALYKAAVSVNKVGSTLGLEGAWLTAIAPDGTRQHRRVEEHSGARVYISNDWDTEPDTTYLWELGGIDAEWNFKHSNYGWPGRVKSLSSLSIDHKIENENGRVTARVFSDFNEVDEHTAGGVAPPSFVTGGNPRRIVPMTERKGYHLRTQLTINGPNNPFEVRGLSQALEVLKED